MDERPRRRADVLGALSPLPAGDPVDEIERLVRAVRRKVFVLDDDFLLLRRGKIVARSVVN